MAGKVSIEDIINKFNRLDINVRLGIFIGVLLAILVIDYFALMQFELKTLNSINVQVKKHKEDIEKLLGDQARLGQIKKSLSLVKDDFAKLHEKIRSLQDLPFVLEDISKMAMQAQIQVDQITPSREGQEDFATVGSNKYFALPVIIKINARYHTLGKFLNVLENSNVMFLVKDLRVENGEKANGLLPVTLTIKVILADKSTEVSK